MCIVHSAEIRAKPKSVSLFRRLPKEDYDALAGACDVGLIFLDYRFTIPNYPSRLLSYLMGKKPIIACTDVNCDTGTIAEENGYGFWAASNSVEAFGEAVDCPTTDCQPNDNVEALRVFMLGKKVECRPVWKPMHCQLVYKMMDCPTYTNGVEEDIFKVGFCLPAGPYVTDEDVRYIVDCIKEALR